MQPKILRKKTSGNSMGIQNAQGETLNVKHQVKAKCYVSSTVYRVHGMADLVNKVNGRNLSFLLYKHYKGNVTVLTTVAQKLH